MKQVRLPFGKKWKKNCQSLGIKAEHQQILALFPKDGKYCKLKRGFN